jgi:hypothetical protein
VGAAAFDHAHRSARSAAPAATGSGHEQGPRVLGRSISGKHLTPEVRAPIDRLLDAFWMRAWPAWLGQTRRPAAFGGLAVNV